MKFLPFGSHVLFLGDTGIGSNFGQIAPQIKYFDIYYTLPPVVGFQVLGGFPPPQVTGFTVEG